MNDRREREILLAPMDGEQFGAFVDRTLREYARDKVLAGQWQAATAAALAREALTGLLPDGLGTAGHTLYVLQASDSGARIGTAWLHFDLGAPQPVAYLYDIRIDDHAQGQGFGRAALRALEAAARNAGCVSLGLHVFGHNERARRMYECAGYRTTNLNMRKDLG